MKTSLNVTGIIIIFLAFLLIIIGCFYLITKENAVVFFMAKIQPDVPVEEDPAKTLIFVGDIMMARGVEHEIKKNNNNYSYPFEKIGKFLKSFNIVFGNLEGAIVENPPVVSDTSFRFIFNKLASVALSQAGFNVVSLANNHADNMLNKGLVETRNFLNQNDIDYVGEPAGCGYESVLEKQGIIFLAFNKTYLHNCSNGQLINAIKKVRQLNKNQFLVVSIHWGEEYKLIASQQQQELAYSFIDAGADLIIGHHPHVVQNIEVYENKAIFYSLGNFIFDQYFSEDTQQGLAVELQLSKNKAIYYLHPISTGIAQPFLMEDLEKMQFLEELSSRSSIDLTGKIRAGRININSG